jgi:tRNA-modifying protein YgfZ
LRIRELQNDYYRALEERAGFLEREDLGRLRLRGDDRRSYLHGILTNDIAALAAGEGCYSALLTAQGRMITDMHVYELGDEILITLPRPLAASIRDRLDQYIFTEDVEVVDATETTVQYGVYGPSAAAVGAGLMLTPAVTVVRSSAFGVEGVEVLVLRAQAPEVEAHLATHGVIRVDETTVETLRVEAGIPKFLTDMTTDTIPLEAAIEARAISMTKGCYPGQEVIVRVLHRGGGRVAKKLVGLRFPGGSAVSAPGEKIRSGEREIGAITSSVWSAHLSQPIALGYVHRDFTSPGTAVQVGDSAAEVSALPFYRSASADAAP